MKDYIRDKNNGLLVFSNPEKEKEIMHRRKLTEEIKSLKDEINILKRQVNELLVKRN
jgi:cell division protein FtsB